MTEPSNLLVVGMGIGTVFFGLICIIFISMIMSAIVRGLEKNKPAPAPKSDAPAASAPIANKQEIVAATCAVIAEELGTDVSDIRIHSFKKVD